MMKLVSKVIPTASPSKRGPVLLCLEILVPHSSNRCSELVHGLAIKQPPEVEQGRLAASQDTVDYVGETLPRSFRRFELHVRGIFEGNGLCTHAPVYVFLCI